MPYFLYFTKSRRKKSPQGGGEAAERQKDLIGLVQSCCLCALIRGLQNLESPFGKGFNFVCAKPPLWRAESRFAEPRKVSKGFNCCGAKPPLRRAESRFAEPRFSLRGNGFILFASCKKNQKARQRFANLWTPGTIQISARFEISVEVTGVHHVTGCAGKHNLSGYRR